MLRGLRRKAVTQGLGRRL